MKLFVITGKDNLSIFKETLSKDYKSINIQGTNDLLEGIETVSKKHVTEEYDLFLILSQKFIEQDLAHQRQISEKLNTACLYALKDLPIYFMVNTNTKGYQEDLESTLTGKNIRLYPYKKLLMSDIKEIIKEVLVLNTTNKKDMSDVQHHILEEKKRKISQQYESHVDRIYAKRSKNDEEDFSSLTRTLDILEQYSSSESIIDTRIQEDTNAKIISEIKNKLFEDQSNTTDYSDHLKIRSLNHSILSDQISPSKLKESLVESNQDYNDYTNYMQTLQEVIEKVKASDAPNKHDMVLDLLREKSVANNQMYEIFTEFLSEVTKSSIDFVTAEYGKEINELHQFGEYNDVDLVVGSKLRNIEELKETRNEMKANVQFMVKQLSETTNLVNKTLTQAGNQYLLETKKIEEEMTQYANSNNLTTYDLTVQRNPNIINTLREGYQGIKGEITSLITTANNTVYKLIELVQTDEVIINEQEDVIDVLMTQKTKKIITVDNLLQSKLSAVVGPEGVGKTHTAINMAIAESKLHKTLLVDLNIYNPNLIYYNRTEEDTGSNRWMNNSTILLEEFIHIPIGKYMHQQIPYKDNLTIIQPEKKINLEDYEKTVNPKVFSLHIKSFLEELAQFYDKIIVILPYDISNFGDLFDFVGVMYMVNDHDPSNIMKGNAFLEYNHNSIDRIPIKHYIFNKTGRNVKLTEKEYIEKAGIDTREYKYFKIPDFQDSLQCKIEGKIPAEHNINTRKVFDDLIKR